MNAESPSPGAADAPGLPPAVDRATFEAELDRLRVREKAHTPLGRLAPRLAAAVSDHTD
jgi:hypothetical protein